MRTLAPIRINDVARRARVSMATGSRTGKPGPMVAPHTRERVMRAIRAIGTTRGR